MQSNKSTIPPSISKDGARDFDFFIGSWHVKHQRLRERLAACEEWLTFNGTCHMQTLMGGLANVDDNILDMPSGSYQALTLRVYDKQSQTWSIWWLDGRHPKNLDLPVVGQFANGIGVFYANDMLNGMPIRVRFLWNCISPDAPVWEQAFSPDRGETWETNWIMHFRKAV